MIYGNRWLTESYRNDNIINEGLSDIFDKIKDKKEEKRILKRGYKSVDQYKKDRLYWCRVNYLEVINGNLTGGPDDSFKYIIDRCKIPREYVNKKCKEFCKKRANKKFFDIFSKREYGDYEDTEVILKGRKLFPEYYNNGNIFVLSGGLGGILIIYSPKTNSFWYGDEFPYVKEYKNITDIKGFGSKDYYFAKSNKEIKKLQEDLNDEFLKIVDAEQGYYLLSDPPAGVKRKELK